MTDIFLIIGFTIIFTVLCIIFTVLCNIDTTLDAILVALTKSEVEKSP